MKVEAAAVVDQEPMQETRETVQEARQERKQVDQIPIIDLGSIQEAVRQSLANIPETHRDKITATFSNLTDEGWAQLQELAYQMVLDGRFQNKVAEPVEAFASYHNLTLPLEVIEWAERVDEEELLATIKQLAMGRIQYISTACPARADFGVSVAVIIGADTVISVAIVALDYSPAASVVVDLSDNADEKL